MIILRVITAAAFALPSLSAAQTQAQQDRIDDIAKYSVTSAMCKLLGATVVANPGPALQSAMLKEAQAWGLPPSVVTQRFQASTARQGRIFGTDLTYAVDNAKTDQQLRDVKKIAVRYGTVCVAAARDPLFGKIMSLPVGFSVEGAATKYADSLLEAGGLASWQTPKIQRRGDLAMLAGACRRVIGAHQSDAIMRSYGRSEDVREREYYNSAFQSGLGDTELNFTKAQCARAINRNKAELAK